MNLPLRPTRNTSTYVLRKPRKPVKKFDYERWLKWISAIDQAELEARFREDEAEREAEDRLLCEIRQGVLTLPLHADYPH